MKGNGTFIKASPYYIFPEITAVGTFSNASVLPEWFGAKRDGVTDDSEPFNKIASQGLSVKLQSGTYAIYKSINLTKRINFAGEGSKSTTLLLCKNIDLFVIKDDTSWNDDSTTSSFIGGFRVCGGKDSSKYNNYIIRYNGQVTSDNAGKYVYNIDIRDITAYLVGGFLFLSDVFRVYVENIRIIGITNGVTLYGSCVQCSFLNCTFAYDLENMPGYTTDLEKIAFQCKGKTYKDKGLNPESIKCTSCNFSGKFDIGIKDTEPSLLHIYNNIDIDGAMQYGCYFANNSIVFRNSWIASYGTNSDFCAIRVLVSSESTRKPVIIDSCIFNHNYKNAGKGVYDIFLGNTTNTFQSCIITNNLFSGVDECCQSFIFGYNTANIIVKNNFFDAKSINQDIYITNFKGGIISGNISGKSNAKILISGLDSDTCFNVSNNQMFVETSSDIIKNPLAQRIENNKGQYLNTYGSDSERPSVKSYFKGYVFNNINKCQLEICDGNKWIRSDGFDSDYNRKGVLSSRPSLASTDEGFEYYDTSLKKKILWNGSAWVNMDGSSL